jgi:hypothetical protein
MRNFLNNLKIVNFENVIHGKKITVFVSLLKERKITRKNKNNTIHFSF